MVNERVNISCFFCNIFVNALQIFNDWPCHIFHLREKVTIIRFLFPKEVVGRVNIWPFFGLFLNVEENSSVLEKSEQKSQYFMKFFN